MGTLTNKGIQLHQGNWINRQEYLSMAKPPSFSHPESANPTPSPTASTSLLESVQLLQYFVNELMKHVRYIEHGLMMVMPSELKEEFESDKILFDSHSDSDSAASDNHGPSSPSTAATTSSADSDLPLDSCIKRYKMIP